MYSEVLTNFEQPESKFYTQHLLLDFRDFQTQITQDLEIKVKLNDLGFPRYENIHSVELKGISFPKMNNDEIYYILDIYEFGGRLHSSDNVGSHEMFAIIYYDNSGQSAGHIKPMKGKDFDEKTYIFNPIEKSLNVLTISFKKYGGTVIKKTDIDSSYFTFEKYPISILLEFKMKYI